MNFEELTETFDQDGVILTNNFFEKRNFGGNEYDELDKNLTNSEIFKDKPLIVFETCSGRTKKNSFF